MKTKLLLLMLVFGGLSSLPNLADDDKDKDDRDRGRPLRATLSGSQEVPALSTPGEGEFEARINEAGTAFDFKLKWEGLAGTTVTQSHIHFGQHGVNGGVMIWLCGSASNPGPAGTMVCPGPASGTVEGTVDASKVVGPSGQGIAATEFAKALSAIRSGLAYANVHTNTFGGGEIRGQIRGRGRPFSVPAGLAREHSHGRD